jgi:hypothetical protein
LRRRLASPRLDACPPNPPAIPTRV